MRAPSILHVTGEAGGEDGRNWCSARNESSGEDEPPLADPLTQIPDPAVPFVFPHVEKRCPLSLVVRVAMVVSSTTRCKSLGSA